MGMQSPERPRAANILGYIIGAGFGLLVIGAFAIWFLLLPKSSAPARVANVVPTDAAMSAEVAAMWSPADEDGTASNERSLQLVLLDADAGEWRTLRRTATIPDDQPRRLRLVADLWTEAMVESGALSSDAALMSAFVDDRGNAFLNFSDGFVIEGSDGLTAELEIVGSLSRTLHANFPTLGNVQLLADGAEIETLGGQLDLSPPLNIAYFAELE